MSSIFHSIREKGGVAFIACLPQQQQEQQQHGEAKTDSPVPSPLRTSACGERAASRCGSS